jgi:trimethylamine--corrinoid protein Co-methyltransferase
MPQPRISLLSKADIQSIHDTSLGILREVGFRIDHELILDRLDEAGAAVDTGRGVARFDEALVHQSLETAGKRFTLHGREAGREARFGSGEQHLISSPGQFAWFDQGSGERREPILEDARSAVILADMLPNISIVGAMAAPRDIPLPIRDVILTAEMVKLSGKPTRAWPISRRSTHYVLEIYKAIAGGSEALRERPMTEMLLEPVSPLAITAEALEIALEFLQSGQPISIGPMAMASATAPSTLAGTLAQENAEILATLIIVQTIAPGTPILYGGIPHIMDPRTSICSFGSPEQALMALAMIDMARFYELPAYVNVNLTDAKAPDAQAGMEKMGSFLLAMLAGADLFGHAGIVGTDHGGSLPWLLIDDQACEYARRVQRGFDINDETLAGKIVSDVGPGGNFLGHKHTVDHFRREFWLPGAIWTRASFDQWQGEGNPSLEDRAAEQVEHLLQGHQARPMEPQLAKEIDAIVDAARRELVD